MSAQKLLGFFTLRCKKPCQSTAGGLYVMNFNNFASVIFLFINRYESWKDRLFYKTKIKYRGGSSGIELQRFFVYYFLCLVRK